LPPSPAPANSQRASARTTPQDNRYNTTKAAASPGITFRALRYKLKQPGIDWAARRRIGWGHRFRFGH
jgi:hypothetical protein